ncbi:LysR family transcriptional regulator [Amycolatopsis alkalitolerans]|uniref:LysR family transcriptional regulator n=1 Tax=Amycolatopsis alkalitolerans TaxID=2547244 RepID=A0A5C4M574_9PSEU|nr:LysR family transcriptional regulator [Amycolatopsis alkalitolerans]TNC27804.1 LysR family transcriptional regulator [Amycolatopsis alkalitolerans]
MDLANVPTVALRVFREVAERGTLTSAAAAMGYTQSAVSRQIAGLERAAQAPLLERRHDGVRVTAAGQVMLRHAAIVLDQIDAAERELAGMPAEAGSVRLGWYISAGAVLVPGALAALRRAYPAITVSTREGTTPVLVRALRAGSLDLAVLGSVPPFRPPDDESPPLKLRTLAERSLRVAVPVTDPLARNDSVDVTELRGRRWIGSPSTRDEKLMGAWPGLDERPEIAHTARDWLAKLNLVAAGCGVTTVPAMFASAVPPGVKVLTVRGGPSEKRRTVLARAPGPLPEAVARVAEALQAAAAQPHPMVP